MTFTKLTLSLFSFIVVLRHMLPIRSLVSSFPPRPPPSLPYPHLFQDLVPNRFVIQSEQVVTSRNARSILIHSMSILSGAQPRNPVPASSSGHRVCLEPVTSLRVGEPWGYRVAASIIRVLLVVLGSRLGFPRPTTPKTTVSVRSNSTAKSELSRS